MTITSTAYDGTLYEKGWADTFGNITPRYGVVGTNDFKVTKDTTVERGIQIATGQGWCFGVMDTSDAIIRRSHPVVATAGQTRYDLVVKRTDWRPLNGGPTTIEIITGGTAAQLPAFLTKIGETADQPLALVPVTNGQFQVGEIIDLRSWSAGGVQIATSDLVRGFNNKIGTCIEVNGTQWLRKPGGPSNLGVWEKLGEALRIPLHAVGSPQASGGVQNLGSLLPGLGFLVQAGSHVNTTDRNGYARLTFPRPFPTGVLTVVLTDGDGYVDETASGTRGPLQLAIAGNPYGVSQEAAVKKNDFVYTLIAQRRSDGATIRVPNQVHRMNWLAIGF